MKAPDFWQHSGPLSALLQPLGWLYHGLGQLRQAMQTPLRIEVPVPVICIGNITAGGSGKTPTVMALGRRLSSMGHQPAVITRGYGGILSGPVRVDPSQHTYKDVGDEALLHARVLPTWVAKDRAAGAKAAVADGASVLLLDDGFQNNSLVKDLNILVFDTGVGVGNASVMPAGPLRESLQSGLNRADAFILIGLENRPLEEILSGFGKLTGRGRLAPLSTLDLPPGQAVYGFAGIGRPTKFAETLIEIGYDLVGFSPFPDHHDYREDEIMAVIEKAQARNAIPVTTEKDFVRLPDDAQAMVKSIPVTLQFEDETCISKMLQIALAKAD